MDLITDFLDFNHGIVDINKTCVNLSPYSQHLVKEIREKNFGINLVYFSGEFPSIYFKEVQNFQEPALTEIRETHRKIWNQGKVPFLYVDSPTEVRVYNCYYEPINPNNSNAHIDDALLFITNKSILKDLEELRNVFGKLSIETGEFWKKDKYAKKLTNQSRINQVLIENLKHTRKVLHEDYKIDYSIIHDILLRSLFLLYLEDRGATDEEFYQKLLPNSKSYYDILESNPEAAYRLFDILEHSFNGNLCPVTSAEKDLINYNHLRIIRECFWDKIEFHGQLKLFDWKVFDFKYVPIELISEIYEEFLLKEEGKNQKAKDGAYYTPHTLVDFILNKVLPWSSKNEKASNCNIKVLDPTCGSGIFLVEAFKRLVDRWKQNNPSEKISFETLIELVRNNIFGIELNEEAIKVAAFSLYLAMLDNLEPKTLWKEKAFPYLIYDPKNKNKNTQGHNLFQMSSLGNGPFSEIEYDLVVGNPPFKKGDLDPETRAYNSEKGYPQEKVVAFLDRATHFCPKGKIALVAASKILFNTSGTYQTFREFLFRENYVEEIYNFSILRKTSKKFGGNLFASAVGPACVIFYQQNSPNQISNSLVYCAPKTAIKNNVIDGIAIDQSDINYLPRKECQNPQSKIWKVAMWGLNKDFNLINRVNNQNTLRNYFKKHDKTWKVGGGLHRPNDDGCYVPELADYPFIPTENIDRYYTSLEELKPLGQDANYRPIESGLFEAPLVILKEGLKNKRFCAAYLSSKAVFKNSVYAITGKVDQILLKALVAFANSSFATYIIFLTASSWGVERDRVELTQEILSLPDRIFQFEKSQIQELAQKVDEIIELKKSHMVIEGLIEDVEDQIDNVIFNAFGLSLKEQWLISDLLNFSLDLFNEGAKSQAYNRSSSDEIFWYVKALCAEINDLFKSSSELGAWATIYNVPFNCPLNIVSLHLNTKEDLGHIEYESSESIIEKLLTQIDKYTYDQFSESLYFRKTVRYYKGDTIYIIKPNEKRFWSKSLALSDADEIILEVSNS